MKDFYFTNNRFKFIALILVIIWLGFMLFFFLKAEEITKDPCSICAKRLGESVTCTTPNAVLLYKKVFYVNGTIESTIPGKLKW